MPHEKKIIIRRGRKPTTKVIRSAPRGAPRGISFKQEETLIKQLSKLLADLNRTDVGVTALRDLPITSSSVGISTALTKEGLPKSLVKVAGDLDKIALAILGGTGGNIGKAAQTMGALLDPAATTATVRLGLGPADAPSRFRGGKLKPVPAFLAKSFNAALGIPQPTLPESAFTGVQTVGKLQVPSGPGTLRGIAKGIIVGAQRREVGGGQLTGSLAKVERAADEFAVKNLRRVTNIPLKSLEKSLQTPGGLFFLLANPVPTKGGGVVFSKRFQNLLRVGAFPGVAQELARQKLLPGEFAATIEAESVAQAAKELQVEGGTVRPLTKLGLEQIKPGGARFISDPEKFLKSKQAQRILKRAGKNIPGILLALAAIPLMLALSSGTGDRDAA